MKREKYRAKKKCLQNTSTDSKEPSFMIVRNHASAPIRKERLESNEQSKAGGHPNKFVKEGRRPYRVDSRSTT